MIGIYISYIQTLSKTVKIFFSRFQNPFPSFSGKGVGSLIGGIMLENLGDRATYQILAAVAGGTSVLYILIDKFLFKKYKQTPVILFEKVTDPKDIADINLNTVSNSNENSQNNANNKSKPKGIDNQAFEDAP